MVLSYYVIKPLYQTLWNRCRRHGRLVDWAAYCADPLDYETMAQVFRHLPSVVIIARNGIVQRYVQEKGAPVQRWPAFPRVLLMCRHATHRFPARDVVKIGFRHGPYHFKRFADPAYYNSFDLFFMTSTKEVAEARMAGIECAVSGGYPKLDPWLNGEFSAAHLKSILASTKHDATRKTVLFTATWDRSGLSAIDLWIDKVEELSRAYNVWVTVHPWISGKFRRRLRSMPGIHFVEEPNALPYIFLSNAVVGDTSSILAEACALNKPMITFRIKPTPRFHPEIETMLDAISVRIDTANQLVDALEKCLQNPALHEKQRQDASRMMFDYLDGSASKRCAAAIRELLTRRQETSGK